MIEMLMTRLQVTKIQAEMALYSGAIPLHIDPEPFIKHWERGLLEKRQRASNKTAEQTHAE